MKRLFCFLVVVLLCGAKFASAAAICPTTTNTNTDCGYILTIGAGDVVTGMAVPGANPYDGGDDALIGVVNNSGAAFTGTITLSGSGNGGGLFAFDSDGICIYTGASYCGAATTGYEGPDNSFSNITTMTNFDDTGTVNFAGLADGGTTFFSLESAPASIVLAMPPMVTGGGATTPEPGSLVLLSTGMLGIAGVVRRRFAA